MLYMVLEEVGGQDMEEGGGALVDGPTDIDLIGVGADIGGKARALVLGALIIKSENILK